MVLFWAKIARTEGRVKIQSDFTFWAHDDDNEAGQLCVWWNDA